MHDYIYVGNAFVLFTLFVFHNNSLLHLVIIDMPNPAFLTVSSKMKLYCS